MKSEKSKGIGFILKVAIPCSTSVELQQAIKVIRELPLSTVEVTAHTRDKIADLKLAAGVRPQTSIEIHAEEE